MEAIISCHFIDILGEHQIFCVLPNHFPLSLWEKIAFAYLDKRIGWAEGEHYNSEWFDI